MTYDEWAAIGHANAWLGVRRDGSTTSKTGASGIVITARSHRYKLLVCYTTTDLTDSEAGQVSGLAQTGTGYWKRCSELRQAGYIEHSGAVRTVHTGSQQRVCSITQAGRDVLAGLA
jgi:hypothetical protein